MLLLLSLASAADRPEGSETLAMGSTSHSNPYANGAIATNPATLGVEERYDFDVAGSYGRAGWHWNVSAVDSKTAPGVAFGVSYSGDRYNPPLATWELPGWSVPGQDLSNRKRNNDIGMGLAIPMFQRKLSVGVGGSVSFFNHERQGRGFTGNATAGVSVRPTPNVTLGLSGRNLLPVTDDSSDRPMELLAGLWTGDATLGALSVEGGWRPEREAPFVLGIGGQVVVSESSRLRGGWRLQDAQHHLAFGAGAGTEKASIDIGMQIPTASLAKPANWTLQLSVRFVGPDINSIRPN